ANASTRAARYPERPVDAGTGAAPFRAAPDLAQGGSSKAVSDLPMLRASPSSMEWPRADLLAEAFSRGCDPTRAFPRWGRWPGNVTARHGGAGGHRRPEMRAGVLAGAGGQDAVAAAEVRPGSAAAGFGRGVTRSPAPAADARSSQGQRPAALAAPLEVAAQG